MELHIKKNAHLWVSFMFYTQMNYLIYDLSDSFAQRM